MVPSSGPAGLFGPSASSCAQLAAHQLNDASGILGRKVSLISVDGGQAPTEVATVLRSLVENNVVQAVVGMHDSDVLRAAIEVCRGRVPYVYTAPYEGGERASGFFCVGETAAQQLEEAIYRLARDQKLESWYLVGNDYSWPRGINRQARRYIEGTDGKVVAETYVPFEMDDYSELVGDIADRKPDCVLISLVGNNSVAFNRAFSEAGLDQYSLRFGPLMEENTLLAIGAESSSGIYSTSSYIASLGNQANKRFRRHYKQLFGAHAPTLTVLGEACYEGILFLSKLVSTVGTFDVEQLDRNAEGFEFASPRGIQKISGRHTIKDIHFTHAVDLSFEIVDTFTQVKP